MLFPTPARLEKYPRDPIRTLSFGSNSLSPKPNRNKVLYMYYTRVSMNEKRDEQASTHELVKTRRRRRRRRRVQSTITTTDGNENRTCYLYTISNASKNSPYKFFFFSTIFLYFLHFAPLQIFNALYFSSLCIRTYFPRHR